LPIERPGHLEDDFVGAVRSILAASSKDDLLRGFRRPGTPEGQILKIRIDRLASEHDATMRRYFDFMERRKATIIAAKSSRARIAADDWASFILKSYGVTNFDGLLPQLVLALSAAYEFEMAINELLMNDNFSVSKNRGDLVDGQQLFYLSDPNCVFVTNDGAIKRRTKHSLQSNRIKSFAELLDCARSQSPLM
jgi:hypothetical protein